VSPRDLVAEIALIPEHRRFGRVTGVMGMLLDAGGLRRRLRVGGQCAGLARDGRRLACEVVGFRAGRAPIEAFPAQAKNEPADLASGGAPLAARLEVPR